MVGFHQRNPVSAGKGSANGLYGVKVVPLGVKVFRYGKRYNERRIRWRAGELLAQIERERDVHM